MAGGLRAGSRRRSVPQVGNANELALSTSARRPSRAWRQADDRHRPDGRRRHRRAGLRPATGAERLQARDPRAAGGTSTGCCATPSRCCNLHVWSPGCPEPARHIDLQRLAPSAPEDRDLYIRQPSARRQHQTRLSRGRRRSTTTIASATSIRDDLRPARSASLDSIVHSVRSCRTAMPEQILNLNFHGIGRPIGRDFGPGEREFWVSRRPSRRRSTRAWGATMWRSASTTATGPTSRSRFRRCSQRGLHRDLLHRPRAGSGSPGS